MPPLGYWYWFLLVFVVVFGGFQGFGPGAQPRDRWGFGGWFVLAILFAIIGLKLFR